MTYGDRFRGKVRYPIGQVSVEIDGQWVHVLYRTPIDRRQIDPWGAWELATLQRLAADSYSNIADVFVESDAP